MNSFKRLLLATTALATVAATPAKAGDEFGIDRVFAVGDSLTDAGTYSNVVRAGPALQVLGGLQAGLPLPNPLPDTLPLPPDGLYHFTNDSPLGNTQNYVDVVAENLGIAVQPNLVNGVPVLSVPPGSAIFAGTGFEDFADAIPVGGTNFAQGGARVEELALSNAERAPLGISQTPVVVQVDRLLASTPSFTERDLVILWAGNNDVLAGAEEVGAGNISPTQALTDVTVAADVMVEQVRRVTEHGPATVVVVTVPRIGSSTPAGFDPATDSDNAAAPLLDTLADTFNARLTSGVAGTVSLVNSDAVLQEILANPTQFGYSDVNQRGFTQCSGSSLNCFENLNSINNDLELVFADEVHPTAKTHSILGQLAYNVFPGVGQVGVMPVATVSALRQQSVGLETRLNLGAFFAADKETGERKRRPTGSVETYGGLEAGFYESDAQQIVPGFDAATQVVKLASDIMITPNVLVGAGISLDHGQVDFAENRGGFDSRLFVGALFGVAQIIPGVYINGIVGGGLVDVYEIERNFDVLNLDGSLLNTQSYEGDTTGNYFVARSNIGAVLPVGNGFFINPSVGFGYEKVSLDGYTETAQGNSLNSLELSIGNLEYTGYRGTAALAGFYRPPSAPDWTFGLRASWEHDFNDDDLQVPFGAGGTPLNTQPAPRPDDSFGLLSATITKELTHSTALNLSGSTNFAQDGVSGYTIGAVLKYTW